MILFFNMEILEKETHGDPNYLIIALQMWFNKKSLAKNPYDKYKPLKKSLKGSSFLIEPKKFFNDTQTDIIFRAQYLKLAAKRDYTLYKLYGLKYLDLSFLPDIKLKLIEANPIISIKQNKIYFKYEEN